MSLAGLNMHIRCYSCQMRHSGLNAISLSIWLPGCQVAPLFAGVFWYSVRIFTSVHYKNSLTFPEKECLPAILSHEKESEVCDAEDVEGILKALVVREGLVRKKATGEKMLMPPDDPYRTEVSVEASYHLNRNA